MYNSDTSTLGSESHVKLCSDGKEQDIAYFERGWTIISGDAPLQQAAAVYHTLQQFQH